MAVREMQDSRKETERPTGELQNQSVDAGKETLPPVEDTQSGRSLKATKVDDAKVEWKSERSN
jgi:hypothetical protein